MRNSIYSEGKALLRLYESRGLIKNREAIVLDHGLTWETAKKQCGADGTENEHVVQLDDPAVIWAGLNDISKRLKHKVAERFTPEDDNIFAEENCDWVLSSIEAGLKFSNSGELGEHEYFMQLNSDDANQLSHSNISEDLRSKLFEKFYRFSFNGGDTELELIHNALQVGLREDVPPKLRAYIGSTGITLATETPIDADFGELTMPKLAEATPKGRLGNLFISGFGLSRMSRLDDERIGLERIHDHSGLKLRIILIKTGIDEQSAYLPKATPTPNGGWQVDSRHTLLPATTRLNEDWRDRKIYHGLWSYPGSEYISRWPDRLSSEPSEVNSETCLSGNQEIADHSGLAQKVDHELAPNLRRAWQAVNGYYRKLRELRGSRVQ